MIDPGNYVPVIYDQTIIQCGESSRLSMLGYMSFPLCDAWSLPVVASYLGSMARAQKLGSAPWIRLSFNGCDCGSVNLVRTHSSPPPYGDHALPSYHQTDRDSWDR